MSFADGLAAGTQLPSRARSGSAIYRPTYSTESHRVSSFEHIPLDGAAQRDRSNAANFSSLCESVQND